MRSELLLDAVAEAGRTSAYAAGTPKLVAQVLAEIPVFAGLSGRQRRRIAEQAEIAEIKAGTSIMREGFTGERLVLLTGAARRARGVPAAEVASGTMIGELSLYWSAPLGRLTATGDVWVLGSDAQRSSACSSGSRRSQCISSRMLAGASGKPSRRWRRDDRRDWA